jgi:hypothetical protein
MITSFKITIVMGGVLRSVNVIEPGNTSLKIPVAERRHIFRNPGIDPANRRGLKMHLMKKMCVHKVLNAPSCAVDEGVRRLRRMM